MSSSRVISGSRKLRNGIDVELVPEHVPAVRLAVEPAGGHAGVVVGGVARADLQDVRDVQAQQQLDALVARAADVADLATAPPTPRAWPRERLVEGRVPGDVLPAFPAAR